MPQTLHRHSKNVAIVQYAEELEGPWIIGILWSVILFNKKKLLVSSSHFIGLQLYRTLTLC